MEYFAYLIVELFYWLLNYVCGTCRALVRLAKHRKWEKFQEDMRNIPFGEGDRPHHKLSPEKIRDSLRERRLKKQRKAQKDHSQDS